MKKGTRALLVAAGVVAAVAAVAGGGDLTDPRDGQKYRTAKIGGFVWMADNLNYKAENSWCYEDAAPNCKKYGRLYDWNAAKGACPSGWHLPNKAEWNDLLDVAGGAAVAGNKLKSKAGWDGTDDFGFSALPGGDRLHSEGSFNFVGSYGSWWSARGASSGFAYRWRMEGSGKGLVYEYNSDRNNGYSVRCTQD